MTNQLFKQLLNLRLYSVVDLVFLGLLAKFSLFQELSFGIKDLWLTISLLLLWFFFNLILEKKHDYNYRAKPKLIFMILSLLIPVVISIFVSPLSLIPLLISTIFVFLYLLKRKSKTLGNLSWFFRGLIQSCYFIYAILFFTKNFSHVSILISILVFLVTCARSLIGDLRDEKNNRKANKQTFMVTYGKTIGIIVINALLVMSIVLSSLYFNILTTIPLISLALSLIFFRNIRNEYYSHQLTVITTMFFSINLVFYFLKFDLLLINLAYLGIFLNIIFYPLLERKSNPKFE
jgi:4-hydroxybenzoate polyprenyltransferase